jgi:Domain of unknown function (DUF4157)
MTQTVHARATCQPSPKVARLAPRRNTALRPAAVDRILAASLPDTSRVPVHPGTAQAAAWPVPIQRCGIGSSCECPPHEKLGGVRRDLESTFSGGGAPLHGTTRGVMERAFASDFAAVRVHTGPGADRVASALHARALTAGTEILFRSGAFRPGTPGGDRLLAHELSHVLQQRNGPVSGTVIGAGIAVSDPADRFEQQAESAARQVLSERGAGARNPARLLQQARGVQRDTKVGQLVVQRDDGATGTNQPAASRPDPGPTGTGVLPDLPPGSPSVDLPPGSPSADKPLAQPAGSQCVPGPGIPSTDCGLYEANSHWLPLAYVINATCACKVTPNVPTANCVRKFLQDRLRATPSALIAAAATAKALPPIAYEEWVLAFLTPRIYGDHVDAYRHCCCPSGPAAFPDWMAVTTVPIPSCSLTGWFINHFGSCTGTPGAW